MKHSFYSFLFSLLLSTTFAQQKPAKLIIRGDDMGFSHAGNEALIKSFKEGFETAIEIIAPSPWFPEAVKLLEQNPTVDVGVHLCLTSEWDNVKWRPITDCPSLKDANGYFFPKIYPDTRYLGQSVKENNATLADIEKEFRAQIEIAKKHIPRLSHISGHMGCTGFSDEVKALTQKLAKEYNLTTDNEMFEAGVKFIGFDGPHKTAEEKVLSFKNALSKLESGNAYIFVEHPAFDNDEIRAVHHIGYENVATDRQGVTDLFTNQEVKVFIKQKGIQLVSYKDWEQQRYFPKTIEKVATIPNKKDVWVFMMAGQSNMAGRGKVEAQDTVSNKRLLTINASGELVYAKEPLHFYQPNLTGLDCGMSFGKTLLQKIPQNITILLIPTAVGGSPIQCWLGDSTFRGVKLLTNFNEKAKIGLQYGTIKGIIWHQGESNANDETNINLHTSRLTALFKIFRKTTKNNNLPILLGELGSYSKTDKNWQLLNTTLRNYVSQDKNAALITTQDLKQKGDYIHFDSESQRKMGERFAIDYLKHLK